MSNADVTALILAGGLGTRLRAAVSDRPKALAEVSGKPFLEIILEQLVSFGVQKAVICVGYMAEKIENLYGNSFQSLQISYSHERALLGTGGAMRFAIDHVETDLVLGLNGDSYCGYDLNTFLSFHQEKKARASLLLSPVKDISAYGSVALTDDMQISSFVEKAVASGEGLVNAGVYLIDRALIRELPAGRVLSLEKDVFPTWVGRGFYGCPSSSNLFIDIGTPRTYQEAQSLFGKPARA